MASTQTNGGHKDVQLTPSAERLLQSSLAPATRKNYESIKRAHESFCIGRYQNPYPATTVTITDWIATNLTKSLKAASIKGYLNALRSYHVENGLSVAAFSDARIDLVIRGGKRIYGEGVHRTRQPLTEDILLRILPHIPDNYDGVNIHATLCTGFAAFLRSGEFT